MTTGEGLTAVDTDAERVSIDEPGALGQAGEVGRSVPYVVPVRCACDPRIWLRQSSGE
jgi:hypothetical protein